MATKRKGKKKMSGRRRGRVGGFVPKKYESDSMMAVGLVGGMLLAKALPAMINKIAPGVNPKVVNGLQSVAGVVGAVMTTRMPLMRGVSLGVGAMGLMDLLTNLGWLPSADAVGADEVIFNLDGVNGYGYGYPSNMVAGAGLGASFNNQNYANNVIAGMAVAGGGYGLYM